jgi:hypothetical protein
MHAGTARNHSDSDVMLWPMNPTVRPTARQAKNNAARRAKECDFATVPSCLDKDSASSKVERWSEEKRFIMYALRYVD